MTDNESLELREARALFRANWQARAVREGAGDAGTVDAEGYWGHVAIHEIYEAANNGFTRTWFTQYQLTSELLEGLKRIATRKGFDAVIDSEGDLCIAWAPEDAQGGL